MAFQFMSDHLKEDLISIDILGSKGCRFAPPRCNLLLGITNRWLGEDDLVLEIQRFSPEGLGADNFMADIMEIPKEETLPETDLLIWDVNLALPPMGSQLWFLNVLEENMVRDVWELGFKFDAKSSWLIAPQPSLQQRPFRCLEFFAGAYGGWKGALEVLARFQLHSQTVGIEIDERASKAYALTHFANWLGPNVQIPDDWFTCHQENWIWQQDVLSDRILRPLSFWQPHVVTISSPCPDWSSAGLAKGLLKPGAKLLFQTVLACRWIRPMYIAIEQVSNFHHHEHKHWILKALHTVGFRLTWQKVCNLSAQAQTNRLRWLGLAERISENVPSVTFNMWPSREDQWPSIAMQLPRHLMQPLFLTAEIVELASTAAFLKTSLTKLPTPEVIFSKRIYQPTDVFPTFMALYGQQHHVKREFLMKHGYLGHFVHDPEAPHQCRFLHPAEIAILHGTWNKVYLDGENKHAWYHLGNMIAIPHALLVLGNLAKSMGLVDAQIDEIFQCFHGSKLTNANSGYRKTAKGGFVMRKDHLLTREFLRHAETLEDSLHKERCQLWSPVHGSFASVEQFRRTKAQTITKDFILQPKSGGPSDMQTATVYRTSSASSAHNIDQPMHPNPTDDALPMAVYRHGHASLSDQSAHAMTLQSSTGGAPTLSLAKHPIDSTPVDSHQKAVPVTKTQNMPVTATSAALHPAEYRMESTATCDSINQVGLKHPTMGKHEKNHQSFEHQDRGTEKGATKVGEAFNPPTNLQAMPLPRLGCGGPSHGVATGTAEIAEADQPASCHANRAIVKLTAEPSRPENLNASSTHEAMAGLEKHTHVPPTHFHAMPLPRLGCGGPSLDAGLESNHNKAPSHIETAKFTSIDPTMYEHCEQATKRLCIRNASGPSGPSWLPPNSESCHLHASHIEFGGDHTRGQEHEEHSPITVKSDTPSVSDTVHFQPVLKGHIQWKGTAETFWYAADLPAKYLERVWELGTCCQFQDLQEETTACLSPMKVLQVDDDTVTVPRSCAQILMDQELTLLKVEPHVPLLQQQQITSMAAHLYDQFGQVTDGQTADYGTILFTEPLTQGVNTHELVYVFAAFSQTKMNWHVCKLSNTITASFTGEPLAVEFLRKFFRNALTAHSLELLGRNATVKDNGDLVFAPCRSSGVTPPNPFLIAISIAAAKTLLDCLETETDDKTGHDTLIKWAGRPVWKGRLQANTTLATLEYVLRMCFVPWGPTPAFRLICDGAQVPLNTMVHQLPINARSEVTLIHAVMAIRGGGQGTKMQQRAIQQNALASTLLDHGFNLAWTTSTVEAIMDKFGLGKLQSVNSQPMGNAKIQAILTLCKEAGVTIPDLSKPKSGNEIPGSMAQKRKKRASDFKLNPSDYTLVEGFFTKGDGSEIQQVGQIIPQACGICILTPSQAEVWVREGQRISADELGLLVLGSINVPSSLASEEVTFPSYNSDRQMVLLTATLIQLGGKTVQHKQGDPQQVPAETCSLVAVTMYKEDWQDEDWRAITSNPTAMVRKQLEAEGLSAGLQAIWGKSLRHQRSPATPVQALTVQVHMTVEDTSLEKLLARSGCRTED